MTGCMPETIMPKLHFSSVYETKVLEIYAHKGEKQKSKEQKEHAKIRECQSGLVELYEAFRLQKNCDRCVGK